MVTLAITFNFHHLWVDNDYKQYDLLNLIWISNPFTDPLSLSLESVNNLLRWNDIMVYITFNAVVSRAIWQRNNLPCPLFCLCKGPHLFFLPGIPFHLASIKIFRSWNHRSGRRLNLISTLPSLQTLSHKALPTSYTLLPCPFNPYSNTFSWAQPSLIPLSRTNYSFCFLYYMLLPDWVALMCAPLENKGHTTTFSPHQSCIWHSVKLTERAVHVSWMASLVSLSSLYIIIHASPFRSIFPIQPESSLKVESMSSLVSPWNLWDNRSF